MREVGVINNLLTGRKHILCKNQLNHHRLWHKTAFFQPLALFVLTFSSKKLSLRPVLLSEFDYHLPPHLIAQAPPQARDASRLLVFNRSTQQIQHKRFSDLPSLLSPKDLLVLNDSRVVPARLQGIKEGSGGRVEVFFLQALSETSMTALVCPAKRFRSGATVTLLGKDGNPSGWQCRALEELGEGRFVLQLKQEGQIDSVLDELGSVPLPPYIDRSESGLSKDDLERYQTVYARARGSVAAPTAGLHFTDDLFSKLDQVGIQKTFLTLHVGLGTFSPVKADHIETHRMHAEHFQISNETASRIEAHRHQGGRVISVGTTATRVLEAVAQQNQGTVQAGSGETDIFIYPPYKFQICQGLITNFHLPKSSLLMLVSAFLGQGETSGLPHLHKLYRTAIEEAYRFYSYGDAMLIL